MTTCLRKNTMLLAFSGLIIFASSATSVTAASVKDLINQLKSAEEAARLEAIDQLGAQGARAAEAVGPLTALLKDGSAAQRARAAGGAGRDRCGCKARRP